MDGGLDRGLWKRKFIRASSKQSQARPNSSGIVPNNYEIKPNSQRIVPNGHGVVPNSCGIVPNSHGIVPNSTTSLQALCEVVQRSRRFCVSAKMTRVDLIDMFVVRK